MRKSKKAEGKQAGAQMINKHTKVQLHKMDNNIVLHLHPAYRGFNGCLWQKQTKISR
jgi:hypothetical protein